MTTTILTDKQIHQAAQCLVSEVSIDGERVVIKNVNGCIRAIEQAVLQSEQVQALRGLASEVDGCFNAAYIEGLAEALAETTDERLKDLVERRLLYAHYAAMEKQL